MSKPIGEMLNEVVGFTHDLFAMIPRLIST